MRGVCADERGCGFSHARRAPAGKDGPGSWRCLLHDKEPRRTDSASGAGEVCYCKGCDLPCTGADDQETCQPGSDPRTRFDAVPQATFGADLGRRTAPSLRACRRWCRRDAQCRGFSYDAATAVCSFSAEAPRACEVEQACPTSEQKRQSAVCPRLVRTPPLVGRDVLRMPLAGRHRSFRATATNTGTSDLKLEARVGGATVWGPQELAPGSHVGVEAEIPAGTTSGSALELLTSPTADPASNAKISASCPKGFRPCSAGDAAQYGLAASDPHGHDGCPEGTERLRARTPAGCAAGTTSTSSATPRPAGTTTPRRPSGWARRWPSPLDSGTLRFLRTLRDSDTHNHFYLGAHRTARQRIWRWDHDGAAARISWHSGEPNNSANDDACVLMYNGKGHSWGGGLIDDACTNTRRAVYRRAARPNPGCCAKGKDGACLKGTLCCHGSAAHCGDLPRCGDREVVSLAGGASARLGLGGCPAQTDDGAQRVFRCAPDANHTPMRCHPTRAGVAQCLSSDGTNCHWKSNQHECMGLSEAERGTRPRDQASRGGWTAPAGSAGCVPVPDACEGGMPVWREREGPRPTAPCAKAREIAFSDVRLEC